MTPYYQDDLVTIYHGDCRDVLPGIGFVDSVITDPPYNVGLNYGDAVDDRRDDYIGWCREWFGLLDAPIIGVSSGIANIGGWYEIKRPDWIVAWNKPAAMGRCVVGFNNWEPVLIWGKTPRPTSDSFTAALIPDQQLDGHPCPKPLRWGTALVSKLSAATDTILDPFLGSGTVAVAAKEAGRRIIGIEIEERYCEIAANRCRQEVLGLAA